MYFDRIGYHESRHAADPYTFLTALQKYQLNRVPFESLSLHYSVDKKVSLEPEQLFHKIVSNKRGGYCLENNRFFAEVLRSLDFSVYHIICRITNATRGIMDGSWRAMYVSRLHYGHDADRKLGAIWQTLSQSVTQDTL